jgi:hypothetical protein
MKRVRVVRWTSNDDAPRSVDTPPRIRHAIDDGDLLIAMSLCREALIVLSNSLPSADVIWLDRYADHLQHVGQTMLDEVKRVVANDGPRTELDLLRHAALLTRDLHHGVRALPDERVLTSVQRGIADALHAIERSRV